VTLEGRVAAFFALDDEAWARHANPWSGWTRFATVLPLLVLAFWSRAWIGWWSLLPIAAALAWTWLNPRAFPPAPSDAAWITKGVFGERFWARRDEVPIPERHRLAPHLLNGATAAGGALVVWGVADLAVWPTLFGAALVTGGKLWYIDRMVWLYADLTAAHPELRYRGRTGRAP
jgi:hypothetical protein